MLYPNLDILGEPERRMILPQVMLPTDYKERVPLFYAAKGREEIDRYAKNLTDALKETPGLRTKINLNWDKEEGLRNIGIGSHAGFDLDDNAGYPKFRVHNLEWLNSIPAFLVATAYVKELLKTKQ